MTDTRIQQLLTDKRVIGARLRPALAWPHHRWVFKADEPAVDLVSDMMRWHGLN